MEEGAYFFSPLNNLFLRYPQAQYMYISWCCNSGDRCPVGLSIHKSIIIESCVCQPYRMRTTPEHGKTLIKCANVGYAVTPSRDVALPPALPMELQWAVFSLTNATHKRQPTSCEERRIRKDSMNSHHPLPQSLANGKSCICTASAHLFLLFFQSFRFVLFRFVSFRFVSFCVVLILNKKMT